MGGVWYIHTYHNRYQVVLTVREAPIFGNLLTSLGRVFFLMDGGPQHLLGDEP